MDREVHLIMTSEPYQLLAFTESGMLPLLLVGAVIVGVLLVFWFIPAVFLLSARIAGIENRSYGKALLAIFLRFFLSLLITAVFSLLPIIGTVIGIVVAFLVNGAVIAGIFSTSFGKGLLTEILFMFFGFLIVLCLVAVGLGIAVLGGVGVFEQIQQSIESGEFSWPPATQSSRDTEPYSDDKSVYSRARRHEEAGDVPAESSGEGRRVAPGTNIALSKFGSRATAGSVGEYRGDSHPASNAIDGDSTTSWCNSRKMPDELQISFPDDYLIDEVGIVWARGAHNQTFSISLSENGSDWVTPVRNERSQTDAGDTRSYHGNTKVTTQTLRITPTRARFMRVSVTSSSAPASHIFKAIITDVIAKTSD